MDGRAEEKVNVQVTAMHGSGAYVIIVLFTNKGLGTATMIQHSLTRRLTMISPLLAVPSSSFPFLFYM